MKQFEIVEHNFRGSTVFYADTLIVNDRRIYAEDYDPDEIVEMNITDGVLSVNFSNGYIRSTNWTFINEGNMDNIDKSDYKDFIRL